MNYLFAKKPEITNVEYADEGEPVIPAFPTANYENKFIGLNSFRYAYYATVKQVTEQPLAFISNLTEKAVRQYPGIPQNIIETYIMETGRAATKLPDDTIVVIYVTPDSAKIKARDSDVMHTLWSSHPKE